ncbi:16S rRNA (cytosine(1402)-N(4))-methyltransferase RsmH [Candidatus Endolissoclinum faulkneri]|uniref:16S rRNA (cytosine(1402)-N(4))-methyltransferase RsmH n=1 Tax=Candidatus Endolissoclinum faulkneri TaxID=1263979 RepID=UPI001ED97ABC|nr:16S rRNA (cytosine(1402)-N(4))-methyltransferase RsmH [Candidatus Endolissoclinum faulkneri]
MNSRIHIPVLLSEMLTALAPISGKCYLDGTFGSGGYTRAILEKADCTVLAIDRDPESIARAQIMKKEFNDRKRKHLIPLQGRFSQMYTLAKTAGYSTVDGVTLDLGFSSAQMDNPKRGFSFRFDGPLDMRMESSGMTAADLVNTASKKELSDIIFYLGEERYACRIAKAIVEARKIVPINRTSDLAALVRRSLPYSNYKSIDPATRTFQALRIYVNNELEELEHGLDAAEQLLAPGGKLAVVSFHSLEDRKVKLLLRKRSGHDPNPSRYDLEAIAGKCTGFSPTFVNTLFPLILPQKDEIAQNPRARSARLRIGYRTEALAWRLQEKSNKIV